MKTKPITRDQLEHVGESLITIKGTDTCLWHLIHFPGRGVFEPNVGLVPVTEQEADIHNKALCKAEIEGLDRCDVGLHGRLYISRTGNKFKVITFIGDVVSEDTTVNGRSLTFRRNNKVFRGRICLDSDLFEFKRIK